jgi:hypothetical protein
LNIEDQKALLVALWSGKPRHKAGRRAKGRPNGFANALR